MLQNHKIIRAVFVLGVAILVTGLYWGFMDDRNEVKETMDESKIQDEYPSDTEKNDMQQGWTEIDNLYAFSKLYGYIKYFHPSDEASEIDWDAFAIYGVKRVHPYSTNSFPHSHELIILC